MKAFVTSDIHGRFDILNKIADFIKNRQDIELIILCGDIAKDYSCDFFEELENKQYSDYKKIMYILTKLNRKIIFIQGNHDVFNVDKIDENYLPYCGSEVFNNFVTIEYTNFFMYGTRREGNEEDMTHRLAKLNINNKSIIVSHIPPYKCLDKADNGKYYGSTAVRAMIKDKKPSYFLCGHVHDSFGFKKLHKTLVFNGACSEVEARGWVVNLETGKHEKIVLK